MIQSAVPSTIQERISDSFLKRQYDECFTVAVGADDSTLGWFLSLVSFVLVAFSDTNFLHMIPRH